VTVVVEGNRERPAAMSDQEVDREIREALAAGKEKRALAREIGARAARPTRDIYARAVALARRP
jgi:hypothetical protein